MLANSVSYLKDLNDQLATRWPDNRIINIVCHGHSVPSGYFCTPYVNTFDAYPHQLHQLIKERFPYAVVNVIVTAIGGENAVQGAARFEQDVLCHKPDVLLLDYGLNDRLFPAEKTEAAWRSMIEKALAKDIKVILITPSWDQHWFAQDEEWIQLGQVRDQICRLADEYSVGLADAYGAFEQYINHGGAVQDLLSHYNHPSRLGHSLIAQTISRWFIAR